MSDNWTLETIRLPELRLGRDREAGDCPRCGQPDAGAGRLEGDVSDGGTWWYRERHTCRHCGCRWSEAYCHMPVATVVEPETGDAA